MADMAHILDKQNHSCIIKNVTVNIQHELLIETKLKNLE